MKTLIIVILALFSTNVLSQNTIAESSGSVNSSQYNFTTPFTAEVHTSYKISKKGNPSNIVVEIISCDKCNEKIKTEIRTLEHSNFEFIKYSKTQAKSYKGITLSQKTVYVVKGDLLTRTTTIL